jgi:hypothetical protein
MGKIKLEESIEQNSPEPNQKPKRKEKRKLRSLVKAKLSDKNCEDFDKENLEKSNWKSKKYFAIALATLIAALTISNLSISSCGFWATYENHYNKIVHGDERHCYRRLEPSLIVERLKEQVVGQDDAIKLVEASLELANREKIIQIAFKGPTGVGKTLVANIIMEHFKWKPVSLIFGLNFQAQLSGQEAFDDDLDVVTTQLKDCGFNLVVIDDVHVKPSTIERITNLERSLHRLAKQNFFKTVLIVVFNGEPEASALLDNFVSIDFNPFTKELLQKCIEVHEKLHNLTLQSHDVEELNLIDFANSGCKTVAKKMNLISKI